MAFLKTGSAYYAPSAAAVEMVEAIALDRRRLLPCSAWLEGEFGLHDVFCGVPCLLGRKGLERIGVARTVTMATLLPSPCRRGDDLGPVTGARIRLPPPAKSGNLLVAA